MGPPLLKQPWAVDPLQAGDLYKRVPTYTKEDATTGTDGWRARVLQVLPQILWEPMAILFNKIENGDPWPDALTCATAAFLGKTRQSP